MSDKLRKEVISVWMERAKKKYAGLVDGSHPGLHWADSLIYVWIAFEAFTCFKFPDTRSADKRVDLFAKSYNLWFKDRKFSTHFNASVKELMKYEVIDMRHIPDSPLQITDASNLQQVIDVVYRVRCNLFHGGKGFEQKDVDLLHHSFIIFYEILDSILRQESLFV